MRDAKQVQSVLAFIFPLSPLRTFQKISTLSSKTCPTGETAFRLRLRQRYCLVAWTKVALDELEDGMRI